MPRPKTLKPKTSEAAVSERVELVYDLLLAGATRREVIQFGSKNEWDLSDRQIDNYIARANAKMAELSEFHRAEQFGKAIARLNDLYKRNLRVSDYKAALATQKELNALLGLHAPTKIEIDWQQELANQGIDASDLFNRLVEHIASSSR